jgi:Kdo2-lipid IVA lauroyltransferase/acyltransferase
MIAWLTGKVVFIITWMGFTLGCLAVRFVPRAWLMRFSDLLAIIGFYCLSGFRTRSVANISAGLGEGIDKGAVERIARRSLRNFLCSCIEIGVAMTASDGELRRLISITGSEHLDAAVAKGSGVVILSAHLGNFFLIGTRLAIDGYPISVLVNQSRESQVNKLLDKYRLQIRQKTIHARPRKQAQRWLRETLRRNEIALVISDEYGRGAGIEVPFFSKTVIARRGAATLALRTNAAVVPACLIRRDNETLTLVIEPELELDRSGKSAKQIRENVFRITRWVEGKVRAYPDQWNWTNIRWWESEARETRAHTPLRQAM